MLADQYDVVIGADTHRDTHALAAVRSFNGELIASITISADRAGYTAATVFATPTRPGHAPGRWRAPAPTAPASPGFSPRGVSG